MNEMEKLPRTSIGQFIPPEFIPAGCDEFYLRNQQSPKRNWRRLTTDEIELLIKNGNTADRWDNLLVVDEFTPHLVTNCEFFGLVRIGCLKEGCLRFHEMTVPIEISNSRIIACDIGDDVAISNVQYMAHYIIGNEVTLLNIDELHTTNHAKFGNGIVKDGEDESVRITLDLVNENGGRAVVPFDGMTASDAYLWAKFRGDDGLLNRLTEITQNAFDAHRGFYGVVGDRSVIKNSRIIKDVKIGPSCYIKGANKLKNLTINSSADEPSQIGEGVELVNGIIGRGCHVFYGVKAVRFVMGQNSALKYGARLIHSYLGDNSTISCCEVLNDLIFPAHEQHHNNSFLIAALVKGQSNIGAGATIGSNHNSRAADGEIEAGRGFWPGLCVSLKHMCRFASYTLITKGDYPCELDIPLPFSLVSNDAARDQLQIMPAFWWMHNMYALVRNASKFKERDQRKHPAQYIEFDPLAPDTVEEIFNAIRLLEIWTAKCSLAEEGEVPRHSEGLAKIGRSLLEGPPENIHGLEVLAENVENSARKAIVLKPQQAYHAYRQMIHNYAVKQLLAFLKQHDGDFDAMCEKLAGPRQTSWLNFGGQLVAAGDADSLIADIKSHKLDSWSGIHERFEQLWALYPLDKQRHAFGSLLALLGVEELTRELWLAALDGAAKVQQFICDQVYKTRRKDHDQPFRKITCATAEEMAAVFGNPDENVLVKQVREETREFKNQIEILKAE